MGGATGLVVGGAMMAGPLGAGVGLVAGHELGKHGADCRQLAAKTRGTSHWSTADRHSHPKS